MIYEAYAPFYDGSGQIRFAVLMDHYIGELLEQHPVSGRRALDLACGTGTLALLLADRGWDVLGIDASETMLAIARIKATSMDTPGRVTFASGDMRSVMTSDQRPATSDQGRINGDALSPSVLSPQSFDLVTCTYDSLNYLLSEADLAACFAGAAWALAPGGLFVGDMNTPYFLEHVWEPCLVEETDGFVQVAQSSFDPVTGRSAMLLTGFDGDDEDGYERFEELHVERAYPPEQVAALLESAGLAVEAAYDCFTHHPHHERSHRIAWVARKRVSS